MSGYNETISDEEVSRSVRRARYLSARRAFESDAALARALGVEQSLVTR